MNYSYSRLSMFDRCPHKFWYKYIDGSNISDNNAIFEKGRYLHSLLEHYPDVPEFEFEFLENKKKKESYKILIRSLCNNDARLQFLFKNGIAREQQFYLDHNLENCEKDDQLLNGVIDYVGKITDTIILCDWKSGKTKKYASFEQLKLYSIWAFNNFPDINNIALFLYFIEQNDYSRIDITREDAIVIKYEITNKIKTIETTNKYNKIKKEDCQFCAYFKDCNPYKVNV